MRPGVRSSEPFIEIDSVRYPLVRDGEIQRRPLTQFAGVNAIGPTERPAKNPALSSITFAANTGRGMGTYRHAVLDGIDTFQRANGFDTRFSGGIVPTPKVDALTTCPISASGGNWDTAIPVIHRHLYTGGGRYIYAYSPLRGTFYAYALTGGTWTAITGGASAVAQWEARTVACKVASAGYGLITSLDGVAFAAADTSQWGGLVAFANRLWSFRHNDNKLYSCTDPTLAIGGGAGAWTAQSVALYLRPGERVTDLVAYRDKGGSPALYVVTGHRLLGYDDDSGEFEDYEDLRAYAGDPTYPQAFVWARDKTLYAIPFGATNAARRHVYQFVGSTDEVGPTERGGFVPLLQFDQFAALSGNTHWLYAAGRGFSRLSPTPYYDRGEIVAYNDQGGWHSVYRPTETIFAAMSTERTILGLCAVGSDVYVMFNDGTWQVIRDRDEMTAAGLRYTTGQIAGGEAGIVFGKTDCGLPNHRKLGASLRVALWERAALPTGYTLQLRYALDGATSYTTIAATDATAFPWEPPLPLGDPEDRAGVNFREIAIEAYLANPGGTMTEAVAVEEVTLYWQRWADPKWAYQAVIDLREETFHRYPGSTFEGKGLEVLRATFEAVIAQRRFHRIKFSAAPQAVDIKAADLVVSGRESPTDGSGLYPFTFRDVTADV